MPLRAPLDQPLIQRSRKCRLLVTLTMCIHLSSYHHLSLVDLQAAADDPPYLSPLSSLFFLLSWISTCTVARDACVCVVLPSESECVVLIDS
jgi:hypothetical protein